MTRGFILDILKEELKVKLKVQKDLCGDTLLVELVLAEKTIDLDFIYLEELESDR